MLEYVKGRAEETPTSRRLVLLRGPPGVDKAQYAQQELRDEVGGDSLASQLAHICSSDDFFMSGAPEDEVVEYTFDASRLAANRAMNEARVRVAMEVGLDPLYVDEPNMTAWEMRPFVLLADRLGYEVVVVPPQEVSSSWNDVGFLATQLQAKFGETDGQYYKREELVAMIDRFEPLPYAEDPRPTIREATPPEETSEDAPASLGKGDKDPSTKLSPSTLLYKLENLIKYGSELMRYTPPDGKGWGVNGALHDDWHSFRERGDGSCSYEDITTWWTDLPDRACRGWSIVELAMLADLKKEVMELPQAELPSAATHPGLFMEGTRKSAQKAGAAASSSLVALASARGNAAAAGQVSRAGAWQGSSAEGLPSVPVSRAERFKNKLEAQEDEGSAPAVADPDAKKAAFKKMAAKAAARVHNGGAGPRRPATTAQRAAPAAAAAPARPASGADDDDELSMLPTDEEEVSAAAFLAAVKSRLTDWGKEDLYHEFVVALSGDVDAKSAVRILRGHHDLLRVFKSKFAPRADLVAIKAELAEEPEEAPRRPSPAAPVPPLRAVKEELTSRRAAPPSAPPPSVPSTPAGSGGRRTAAAVGEGPKPPAAKPPSRGVKRELVKGEVKSEDVPRPPSFAPNMRRGIVTIGDDSDEDEEMQDEASIAAAVRKGRDECVAQLAKLVFRKERAAHDGARARLAMVRYATQRAACPRFPRELFILRGAPGVGKTEYAMQQLADSVEFDPEDEVAVRLTHICSADDFFERFSGTQAVYKFDPNKVDSYHAKNETRVRLAMEAGIHPLYVDCTNMRRWEMKPYIELADRLGYVANIVEPHEICEKCDDAAFLASATDTVDRKNRGKVVPRGLIAALLKAYEPLTEDVSEEPGADPFATVRTAVRPEGPRMVEAIELPPEPSSAKGKGKGKAKGKDKGGAKGAGARKVTPAGPSSAPVAPPAWAPKRFMTPQGIVPPAQKVLRASYGQPSAQWH
mmetsp:Transcript_133379/g.345225  ORF Transcript_133379/g.345225 Transcript_133379/m.345225 type:complete len:976 (+) Transcript_133379:762-3689(+)